MRKLASRVDRIYRRTHRFLSNGDLNLIRSYLKAELEKRVRSPDHDANVKRLKDLLVEYDCIDDPSQSIRDEVIHFARNEMAVGLEVYLEWLTKVRETFPKGMWVPLYSTSEVMLLKKAQIFFRNNPAKRS
jgi:hypothetical protein